MKFKDALKKLREIAKEHGEDFVSIGYDLTESKGKVIRVGCRVYYHEGIAATGKTWDEAFAKLDAIINPKEVKLDLKEAPTEEA